MAALAVVVVAEREVIGIGRARELVGVAELALDRRADEAADVSLLVAAIAGHREVRADQREARACVLADRPGRPPRDLVVAAVAARSERALVGIDVAAAAAAREVLLHRAAIVYVCDYTILEPCLRVLGLHWADPRLFTASLDNA